jgi:hypothetical protein
MSKNRTPKSEVSTLVSHALTAAASAERGQVNLHKSLIEIISYIARTGDGDLTPLTKYVQGRRAKSPKGNITLGVEMWLEKVLDLKVGEKDSVVRKNKKKPPQLDAEWVAKAKATPWYDVVASALEFKIPKVSYAGLASTVARREYLGEQVPTDLLLVGDFISALKDYKAGDKFTAWKTEADVRLANGEIQRLDA